jgi:hypothetical protein
MLVFESAAFAIAAYLLMCLVVWKWQARLIFMPARAVTRTPASLGVNGEEVRIPFQSREGQPEQLDAFWLPADPAPEGSAAVSAAPDASSVRCGRRDASAISSSKAMLYLHGNGDNIGVNLPHAALLRSLGISVLLFDYRGYGRSTGPFPSEARVYEDAEVAWKYLVTKHDFSAHQIVIYGHSLGGAIAIELASRHPEAAGVIVESSLTSAADMARRMPVFWLFPLSFLLHHRFESLAKVGALCVPILLLHGTRDWSVPTRMTKSLFAAASEPKTMVIIDAGGHLDNWKIGGALYLDAIREFTR